MTILPIYEYIGVNGTITSTVLLECPHKIEKRQLTATPGYYLTNGTTSARCVTVTPAEVDQWTEQPLVTTDNNN